MICKKPFVKDRQAFPCGQCLPCRVNRRRQWTSRIVLESYLRKDNAFVTLTYADGQLPLSSGAQPLPTLLRGDLTDWLKRIRWHWSELVERLRIDDGRPLRYFAVGEYSDAWRPHYHVALFGFPRCVRLATGYDVDGRVSCCAVCELIERTWSKGRIHVGGLTRESAAYIAGYTVKKLTGDHYALEGRSPEFAAMSRRPGIGRDALYDVASEVLAYEGEVGSDVPNAVVIGRRRMPIGRYMRRELRRLVGRAAAAPQATLDEAAEAVRPLFEAAEAVTASAPASVKGELRKAAFLELADQVNAGAHAKLQWVEDNLGKRDRL